MPARELHGLPRNIAHDPCHVSGRNLVGIARLDAEGRAVVHADGETAGDGVTNMAMLARVRAGDRGHVRRPAPSGQEDEAADGDLVERDDLDDAVRKPPDLVRAAESLSLKSRHGSDVSQGSPRIPEAPIRVGAGALLRDGSGIVPIVRVLARPPLHLY